MTTAIRPEVIVENISVKDIKIRFRRRLPTDTKVKELASSIANLSLLNPITIDNRNYLVSGYHRLKAVQLLGHTHIPCIRKDFSKLYAELAEIEENDVRTHLLSKIEQAENLVRREEIYAKMGKRMSSGFNSDKALISTSDLAALSGLSKRHYRLKRQPVKIVQDVRDQLRNTKFAEVLTDMVKLSQQEPDNQRKICELLISGKCSTFKRAFVEGNIQMMRKAKEYKINFDMKARWGTPHSIMRFTKAASDLQSICNLVSKDEELEWIKRSGIHFGETTIPVYAMSADHAEFLVTYYTPEEGLVLDNFMGRATNGIASLFHGRRFIGYDVNKKNVERTREVMKEHFEEDKFQLFHGDGVTLEEFKDQSEILDAVINDPPYILKNERYNPTSEIDLSNLDVDEFMERIEYNFKQLYRLIKRSDFKKKIFYPVITKVGTGRRGTKGIYDMDLEFQIAAKKAGFVLWDKLFNQLHSPWGAVNWERNYINRYTQKNYETNLVFCKF